MTPPRGQPEGGDRTASDGSPAPDGSAAVDGHEAERPDGSAPAGEGAPGRPAAERPLPPGPDGYPFVGSLLPLVRDPFAFFDDLASYGDVVGYRVAGRRFTALLNPDHVERVLVAEPDRFERWLATDLGLEFAPDGLLFAGGEQWRRQRRLVQPAFTVERIRSYAAEMVEYAEAAADGWADGEVVALNRAFSKLTLRVLSKALFDLDVDPAAEDEAITRGARAINRRAGPGRNLTGLLPDWVPTPANRRYRRAMADYRERVTELMDRRRATDDRGDDLLSLLLDAGDADGEGLSDEEVRDDLLTFTFAGHETTSLGLTYACALLAEHDDVAARLRAELDATLDGESPRFEHVADLEYTGRVVREAMRLYPPAFVLFREATGDAVFDGYRVPEGSYLTLPQFHLHTDGRFWDAPGEFRPERWAADRDRPEYAYFPFGGGPRHCIGMRFATLEMKLVLAVLASRFEMTLLDAPEPDPSVGATLQPSGDVRVRLHRRERA